MGYFNIFYKITRIIDMLTRKRNRKFILALCLVGAVVFFSPSTSNAQWDTVVDRSNLNTIRSLLTNIHNYCTNLPAMAINVSNMTTDLNNMQLDLLEAKGYLQSIEGDTEQIKQDIQTTYDLLESIKTDINNNATVNHNDLEEIKTILKDYLYGDKEFYDMSYNTFPYIRFDSTQKVVYNDGRGSIYEVKVKKDHVYKISFTNNATWRYAVPFAFSTSYIKPVVGTDLTNYYIGTHPLEIGTETIFTYNATTDGYLIFAFQNNYITLNSVTSDYNEGQENGLYGGLTDINNQTRQQGEQTRDTITSTNYNSEDVNINTDSISNIDSGQTEGLFTTIFNNFNIAISGGVNEIEIPMPNGAGNITLRSDIVSSHIGNLSALISAFWYFIFGFYAFKFVNNLLHNIKDGSILDGFKNNNEVITQDML